MKAKNSGKKLRPLRREFRLSQLSELYITYEGDAAGIPVRPPDISASGMFVNTTTHFPEGAVINLRFRLTRSNVEVQTRGEVRYCLAGIGIGVEFIGLGPEMARLIDDEIRAAFRPLRRKD